MFMLTMQPEISDNSTKDSLSIHWVINNQPLVSATLHIDKSAPMKDIQAKKKDKYSFCSHSVNCLTLIDFGLMAQFAYFDKSIEVSNFTKKFFEGFQHMEPPPSGSQTIFYDLYS